MKKLLLIIGIIVLAACVLALVFALWNWYAFHHVLDGSAALYDRLHRQMNASFVACGVLAAIGALCVMVRFKL